MRNVEERVQAEGPRRGGVRRAPEVTRREILEATASLLAAGPFRDLTIGRIMGLTQVGRSAFYAHFADVYAVVEELLAEIRDEEIAHLEQWERGASGAAGGLEELVAGTVSLWTRRGPTIASMLDAAPNDGRIAALFDEITSRYCDAAAAALRHGYADVLAPDLDADEVAALVIHGTQAYLKERLGAPGRGDPQVVATTLTRTWAAALAPVDLASDAPARATGFLGAP